jgi:HNH endonuclease/AP2 domain
MITQERVKQAFDYVDGKLIWKSKTNKNSTRIQIGKEAGYIDNKGYKIVNLDGKAHKYHRIVFLYHHGYLPKMIDHIDCDRSNNRIENLRECNDSQNQFNKNKTSKNTTGVKGVDYRKNNGKYRAQIYNNKKCHNLGYYNTLEEAKEVVEKFRESLHKEFTNHG